MEHGADLVLESLTKIMNGHSDVLLGVLCGTAELWDRIPTVVSAWGLSAPPFDCWLAARGLGTLALRADRADENARVVAAFLLKKAAVVEAVHYPGLPQHADHALARRQFGDRFGNMVTFTLRGGTTAAQQFMRAAQRIPFSPSLGDLSTTLSHPASTSHRKLSPEAQAALDITGGTIRLSIGIESAAAILEALEEGLSGLTAGTA
jgi:cystathionine beta-lyase/cystathionine gamma-synthase